MQYVSWWRRGLVCAALLCVAACASGGRTASFAPVPEGQTNLIVNLSNQSSARRSVVLAVYVDGQLALRKEMASVYKPAAAHDFPEAFPLCVPRGPHTIKVVAEGQVASASTEIVVGEGTVYVDAAYFWEPGSRHEMRIPEKITISAQAKPFGYC